ncbi:RNA polymerase I associated factor, A49-like protein [Sodiomyces alkalinus F11]|uniref:RNA polymerase I associated factor, A49-like protein n=1 Tax=Sodiomyces alkalinus (strain CBS 110278 / VKM F-3762 / F11) TaxID=1314773 RepID=A0A3N2PVI4_SODAK|nr:RNA polymerase I associated factor, A49-like protein [Sodiomyces alkalinus F11]ROT38494.1 RNA polymerase I associated factor, A49-like protein [Sodiomyces alkalinus F11]
MAEVNGRKRKRTGDEKSKPKKKAAIAPEMAATSIHITSITKAQHCPPVIASAPGLQLQKNVPFRPYQKRPKSSTKKSRRPPASAQELVLHSAKHRTVDLTAREEGPTGNGGEPLQKQYLAIFDPQTGKMEVMEAKKLVVRGTVRARHAAEEAMTAPADTKSYQDQKIELGQTFGTRKAKKAIESNAMNAIVQDKVGADGSQKLDAASKATLSQIGEATASMATREQLQAAIDESKPVPPANLEAEEIADVYDPNVFIGAEVLKAVPVRDWHEATQRNDEIQVMSRYVAARVQAMGVQDRALEKLRLLRYLHFLVVYFVHTKEGRQKGTRRIPPKEIMARYLAPAPPPVVEHIRRKFSEGGEMCKFHIDLLATHCCVLTCLLDNFETDPQDIREDLRLDQKTMNQYFHEIGARVLRRKRPGETKARTVVKLALPLQFPKQSRGAPKKRR